MIDCIFCRIVSGQISSEKVYEDEYVIALKDINPVAKVHVVVFPKVCRMNFHDTEDKILIFLLQAIKLIIKKYKLECKGYRLVNNNGVDGRQSVNHIHFHIIGGEFLGHQLAGF